MSYLDEASLLMIPSGYKEDKIFTQLPEDGSGDLTFTRASDGTRVNSEGYIERVPWNLLQQSNTFNTTWTTASTYVTSGQSDKDGGTTAWLLTKTGANGYIQQVASVSGLFTQSIYAKAGTLNWIRFTNSGISGADVYFDLVNGIVGNTGGGVVSTSIISVGNGWFFITVNYNGNGQAFRIFPAYTNGSTSGTSGNIYIQNAQLNEGPTAKPYIATTNRQDVPRLDYSNGCPCLLLEPQRTNTMLNSNNLNSWLKIDTSVTSNSTTSPDGTQNADTVTATGLGSTSHLIYQNLPFTSGTAHTLSVFAKANTSNFIQLIFPGNLIANSYANFDLVNGTITASANLTPKIESMGDGWYRCSISATAFSSSTNSQIVYLINSATASRGQAFTANGESVYLWGGQFEQSSYATSYIPTTSAAVTRVADSCYKTGISSLIGQSEGTLYWEGYIDTAKANYGFFPRLTMIGNGTGANFAGVLLTQSNQLTTRFVVSNSNQATITHNITTSGTYKIAFAYKANDFVLYVNGVNVGTDTSGTVTGLSNLYIGYEYGDGSTPPVHPTNQAALFKTRLTNDQLAALTTL